MQGKPMSGSDEELVDWLCERTQGPSDQEVNETLMELLMNDKKTGTDYVKVSVVGDSLWLPASRVEVFLEENSCAELTDLLPAELVQEKFDVLNGDDLEMLHDAGATWAVGMQNCPWTPDFLRRWNAVILLRKDDVRVEQIR